MRSNTISARIEGDWGGRSKPHGSIRSSCDEPQRRGCLNGRVRNAEELDAAELIGPGVHPEPVNRRLGRRLQRRRLCRPDRGRSRTDTADDKRFNKVLYRISEHYPQPLSTIAMPTPASRMKLTSFPPWQQQRRARFDQIAKSTLTRLSSQLGRLRLVTPSSVLKRQETD